MSGAQTLVMNDTKEKLRQIGLRDGRYSPEAFYFLFDALELAVRLAGKENLQGPGRHVTGQEVVAGMRAHAVQSFGPLAAHVWRTWGVETTMDWGRIVFLLVDHGLLKRQDEDKLEDFRDGFDFDTAFEADYRESLKAALSATTPKRES